MRTDAKQRARDKIARLAGCGLDLVSFWRASTEVLASAVPNDGAPCWFTLDPASLLVTSHFDEGVPELPPQWLVHEYYQDDVNKLADVARSQRGISTLHEATGGDPTSSPRWHFNMTLGGDQELIAALRTPSGEVWGGLGLYRETGQSMFDDQELAFVRQVAPHLAEGARRAWPTPPPLPGRGRAGQGRRIPRGRWPRRPAGPGGPPRPATTPPDGQTPDRCRRTAAARARGTAPAPPTLHRRGCAGRRSVPGPHPGSC